MRFNILCGWGQVNLYKMADRTTLQSADNAVKFVSTRKIDSFESLAKFTADKEQGYSHYKLSMTASEEERSKTAAELAYAEVVSYNKKNLEREPQNESRQNDRQQRKVKRREEEI